MKASQNLCRISGSELQHVGCDSVFLSLGLVGADPGFRLPNSFASLDQRPTKQI